MEETTKNRHKYFNSWCFFLLPWGVDPFMGDTLSFKERMHFITSFGGMVRQGELGRGRKIRVGSVRSAIAAVAQTIALDKGTLPFHNDAGDYHLPIRLMLAGFGKEDPATEKKLAVGVDVPELCCKAARRKKSARARAIGDLILIAFYFLLRIGEYTRKARRNESKQTVQFRMKDVLFFKKRDGRLCQLPPNAPKEAIMSADGATLRLSNQKNGYKNSCIHQEHNGRSYLSPVRALGRRYCHIRDNTLDPEARLSTYFDAPGELPAEVTDKDIRATLKAAAVALNYEERGIPTNRVDTHSLRAGGANALALSGYSDREIMKMGRWRSATFMEYISEQLSSFSKGMSKAMSRRFHFVNVEGGVLRDITNQVVGA